MKILHCIPNLNLSSGGPSLSVWSLVTGLRRLNIDVDIVTYESQDGNDKMIGEGLFVKTIPSPRFRRFGYSAYLNNFLQNTSHEIFHGNGLWQYPVHATAKAARKKNKPYIISPHGMLEPWSLNAGKWKKKLALFLYQRNDLAKAACIHATASMEAENIRKLGFKNPIAVIPNGIDISEYSLKPETIKKEKNTILFLSRIHPKKGIENLIEAWNQTKKSLRQNWQIEIAGNGEQKYIASLQKLIETKGLQEEIKIIGPQYGSAKLKAYHQADLFMLPTYSENFGMVVTEALSCGVPVITTKGTPWEELNTYNAGWWIDIGVQPLVEVLQKALCLSEEQRQQMGQNGRKLVEEKYSIEAVAAQMIQLYKWILNGGEKPQFVYAKS
jgi:glycosyltransferase involved in cell wall biosynthesis